MKKTDFVKLKTKTSAELQADLTAAKESLWQSNRDIAAGKLKNVRQIRSNRTDIARLMTLINQKNK